MEGVVPHHVVVCLRRLCASMACGPSSGSRHFALRALRAPAPFYILALPGATPFQWRRVFAGFVPLPPIWQCRWVCARSVALFGLHKCMQVLRTRLLCTATDIVEVEEYALEE